MPKIETIEEAIEVALWETVQRTIRGQVDCLTVNELVVAWDLAKTIRKGKARSIQLKALGAIVESNNKTSAMTRDFLYTFTSPKATEGGDGNGKQG